MKWRTWKKERLKDTRKLTQLTKLRIWKNMMRTQKKHDENAKNDAADASNKHLEKEATQAHAKAHTADKVASKDEKKKKTALICLATLAEGQFLVKEIYSAYCGTLTKTIAVPLSLLDLAMAEVLICKRT